METCQVFPADLPEADFYEPEKDLSLTYHIKKQGRYNHSKYHPQIKSRILE